MSLPYYAEHHFFKLVVGLNITDIATAAIEFKKFEESEKIRLNLEEHEGIISIAEAQCVDIFLTGVSGGYWRIGYNNPEDGDFFVCPLEGTKCTAKNVGLFTFSKIVICNSSPNDFYKWKTDL